MRNIILLVALISSGIANAQIVDIPDANFKAALLRASPGNSYYSSIAKDIDGNWVTIDVNKDNEIQVSEAENIYSLYTKSNYPIHSLTGIEEFINLEFLDFAYSGASIEDLRSNINLKVLDCAGNNLTNLDLSNNVNLEVLRCDRNNLVNLDLSSNVNLEILNCNDTDLTNLDLSNNVNLDSLYCLSNDLVNLDLTNNVNLEVLYCSNNDLVNLDLSNNVNLEVLYCGSNDLANLDLSNNVNLEVLICSRNQLTNLDLSNNMNLEELSFYKNQLTSLDLSNNINLEVLNCARNQLTNIDISLHPKLKTLACYSMPHLGYLNLKNGNKLTGLSAGGNPNLNIICIDDINDLDYINFVTSRIGHPAIFTEDCSVNQINGSIKLDANNNGCDPSDLPMPNLMLHSNNGTESFATFTQNNGNYSLYTNEGNFTTSVTIDLPKYYIINPSTHTNTFTGFNNTFTADFCIEASGAIDDVNISLIPTSQARPGFDATYQIVYKNVGTTQLNGNVVLEFDETNLSFLEASETVNAQTSNTLIFDYTNLDPFETRIISLEFNVFKPPTVHIAEILNFTTTINPIATDTTANDNVYKLAQTVIGSFDPNDINVLEGDEILLADANNYLHYVIRFQNTGTASAINVVVKNNLDEKLDWSTLQLESLSHDNRVAIKNGNEVAFIFNNIYLPDSTSDEPNSHGFIAYKIKPKVPVAHGDVLPNKADIFFDFNEAVETNTVTTTIVNPLSVYENPILDFSVYPIPTGNILNIQSNSRIVKIEIYSKLGQLIINTTENKVDLSNLTQGLYFVKVKDVNGNFNVKKIVKK